MHEVKKFRNRIIIILLSLLIVFISVGITFVQYSCAKCATNNMEISNNCPCCETNNSESHKKDDCLSCNQSKGNKSQKESCSRIIILKVNTPTIIQQLSIDKPYLSLTCIIANIPPNRHVFNDVYATLHKIFAWRDWHRLISNDFLSIICTLII